MKPAEVLVGDEARAYAASEERPSSLLPLSGTMRGHLNDIRDWRITAKDLAELRGASQAQSHEFAASMKAGHEAVAVHVKGPKRDYPTFERYWGDLCRPMAEGFAERCGRLAECRSRGIDGLLEQPAVRAAAASGLSLTYAQTFEGVAPRASDSRDMLHVTLAGGGADVLVTHDERLARIASRIPLDGFRVLRLPDLLAEVG